MYIRSKPFDWRPVLILCLLLGVLVAILLPSDWKTGIGIFAAVLGATLWLWAKFAKQRNDKEGLNVTGLICLAIGGFIFIWMMLQAHQMPPKVLPW